MKQKNIKKKKLKFLIVGLGSMGKRRVRNLHFNNQRWIVGYDIRPDRRREAKQKYGIEIIDDFKKIVEQSFDVMIISTPPDQHGDYIRMALKLKKHFFTEHPTSDDGYKEIFSAEGADLLAALSSRSGSARRECAAGERNLPTVKAPSCTLRYYLPVKMIKNFLVQGKIGKILAFQYHTGQYLPDWHPYEDYRKVYFSKKATGACREIFPFELIWLNWLFDSRVKEVCGFTRKVSNLKMDADDIILANLKYKNGILGNVIIDAISRKPYQTLRVLGSKGSLDWEGFDSVIKLSNLKSKTTKIIAVPKGRPKAGYINEEEMYNNEIKAFLRAIDKKTEYPHSFAESLQLLKTLYALEESDRTGKKILL